MVDTNAHGGLRYLASEQYAFIVESLIYGYNTCVGNVRLR